MAGQAKNWCFTINNPTEDDTLQLQLLECTYIVYQLESGNEGNVPHFQGYVQFGTRKRLATLSTLLTRAHLSVARGSPHSNKIYCTKEDTRTGGPWERGTITGGQGSRTDVNELREMVRLGSTDESIILAHTGLWLRYRNSINAMRHVFAEPRNFKSEVRVYWGAPGVGKSRRANEEAPNSYYLSISDKSQSVWWDGYNGHSNIIIDDFYGWLPWSFLLRLCDRYPFQVQTKGGHVQFAAKLIIFTSNSHPKNWYTRIPNEDWTPFERRIDKIEEIN